MLQQARANEGQTILRVDERLADRRVALERSHAELAARDCERERLALLGREREADLRRQRADRGARDAVRARLAAERLDGGRDLGVDGVRIRGGEDDVRRPAVEDEDARLLERTC